MSKITKITKNLGGMISKNSPHILTGLGCAGVISTAILAAKASPRANLTIDNEMKYRKKKNLTPLSKWDKVKVSWKFYLPAGAVGAATIGCIIGANTVNTKRNAALASLYALSESAFREYKTKVVQEIGKTKETKIQDEIAKDEIANNPPVVDNVFMTGLGESLCYDRLTGRYFTSSFETIRQKINDLNYELRSEMRLDLNELYYAIGLPPTELGNQMEFNLEISQIDPIYSTQLTDGGRPCLTIDFDVYPKYYKR